MNAEGARDFTERGTLLQQLSGELYMLLKIVTQSFPHGFAYRENPLP